MSSKLHVCLFQTIGAEVIEPVLWSSLDSRIRVICYAYYWSLLKTSVLIYVLLIISHVGTSDFSYNHSSRLASHFVALRCNDWGFDPRWSWPKGTTIMCPQVLINGSPTFSLQRRRGHKRRFCKKQSIFRISESLFCVDNGVVRSKFTKIEIISVVLLF